MSALDLAAKPQLSRHETVQVALLLASAGGYLDAYTWIIHGVMANAQTANLVLLWVFGSAGNWTEALHFVPPLAAFAVGVVAAAWLRRAIGDFASVVTLLVEILVLLTVAVIHKHLPDMAGTLGISLVAAMQTSVFTKVEGATYSSVMVTGNLRQAVEGTFAALHGSQIGAFRRPGIFAGLCAAFGAGAAIGAFATKLVPSLALGVPVLALLVVLLRCDGSRHEASP